MVGLCTALYELQRKVVSPIRIEKSVKNVYTVTGVGRTMHEFAWRLSQHHHLQKLGRPTNVKLKEFELRIYRILYCKNKDLERTFKPNIRRNTVWSLDDLKSQYERERSRGGEEDLNVYPVLKLVTVEESNFKYDGYIPDASRQETEATEATTSEDEDADAHRARRPTSRRASKRARGSGGGA
jgi:hypothetical protein